MIKKFLFLILVALFFLPFNFVSASDKSVAQEDFLFKAEVIEILDEEERVHPDGREVRQQNLRLLGLEGEYLDKEVVFEGIGDFEVLDSDEYKKGDKVLVAASQDAQGNRHYYVVDHVRTTTLWFLAGFFVFFILLAAGWKGLRSLISLSLTLIIVVAFIIPQIIAGANPLVTTLVGSFLSLLLIIYITEGWGVRSHLAVASIFLSLFFILFLSWIFIKMTHLTGAGGDESILLLNSLPGDINFQGLLLAGIVIGSLGVLGDMVISQIVTTEEIYKANNFLTKTKLFKKSYRVGSSHISSMVNTLFLAYAGASLPLLILFSSSQGPFSSWQQIISTEMVAIEVVRTLCGSIGLILAAPLATGLAVWYYKRYRVEHQDAR